MLTKKLSVFIFILFFGFCGCAKNYVPHYLQKHHPYIRRFHGNFELSRTAVTQALQDMGWTISEETEPEVYEHHPYNDLDAQQILLITDKKEIKSFWGRRYSIVNVFLRHKNNVSEIEIRIMKGHSVWLKEFRRYRDDKTADRLFESIEQTLGGKTVQ